MVEGYFRLLLDGILPPVTWTNRGLHSRNCALKQIILTFFRMDCKQMRLSPIYAQQVHFLMVKGLAELWLVNNSAHTINV